MKTVFSNRMCAHVWAQLTQPHGHSASMSFDGSVAYSYRQPVAHIVAPKWGSVERPRVVLFTSDKFSNTTCKHMHLYKSATNLREFNVPNLLLGRFEIDGDDRWMPGHQENLKYLAGCYYAERDALLRVPASSWRISTRDDGRDLSNAHATLRTLAYAYKYYAEAFNLPRPDLPWYDDAQAIIARRDRILLDPKRAAKAAAREAARERAVTREREERFLKLTADIAQWRIGAKDYLHCTDAQGGAMLRLKGDEVQTSQGARVPVSHAVRALRFWRLCVNSEALPWTRGDSAHGDSETRVGHFTVDSINEAGTIKAGCHTIYRGELEAIEPALLAWTAKGAE